MADNTFFWGCQADFLNPSRCDMLGQVAPKSLLSGLTFMCHQSGEGGNGKAAKRMYNVFRLTGRYQEAAFVRELFDEPATVLYQVWSLIRTLDDAVRYSSSTPMENLLSQADQLIMAVIKALEGDQEAEIVL